jgi:hypothetical protein
MRKQFFLLFVIIFFRTTPLCAQVLYVEQHTDELKIQDNISRVNISMQGFYYSFEKRLAPMISFYTDFGLGAVFGWNMDMGYRWAISPIFATEGRWYFNYKKRYEVGKKLLFNAADFLSLQGGYMFKPIDRQQAYINSGYFLLTNIGMQRTWGKHINFELKFGLGIAYSDEYNSGGTTYNINLKFGYVFGKI